MIALPSLTPRGLSRDQAAGLRFQRGFRRPEAAKYFGISATKFDTLVSRGLIPVGFTIDRIRLWDIRDLDRAFEALKGGAPEPSNPWD